MRWVLLLCVALSFGCAGASSSVSSADHPLVRAETPCAEAYAAWRAEIEIDRHHPAPDAARAACSGDEQRVHDACIEGLGIACFTLGARRDLRSASEGITSAFERGCAAGYPEACASVAARGGDEALGERACDAGVARACWRLAHRSHSGEDRARYLTSACDAGIDRACLERALMLSRIDGRHAEAAAYYRERCDAERAAEADRMPMCESFVDLHVQSAELPFNPAALSAADPRHRDPLSLATAHIAAACRRPTSERCEAVSAQFATSVDESLAREAGRRLLRICSERECPAACGLGRERLRAMFHEACDASHRPAACVALGRVYENQCGGAPEPACAMSYYRAACVPRYGVFDPASPPPTCENYMRMHHAGDANPAAEGCAHVPFRVAIGEANNLEEAIAAMAHIRDSRDIEELMAVELPGLPRRLDNGTFIDVAFSTTERVTGVRYIRGRRARRAMELEVPGLRAEDVSVFVQERLLPHWRDIAARIDGSRLLLRLVDWQQTGDPPDGLMTLTVSEDARHVIVRRGAEEVGRERLPSGCEFAMHGGYDPDTGDYFVYVTPGGPEDECNPDAPRYISGRVRR